MQVAFMLLQLMTGIILVGATEVMETGDKNNRQGRKVKKVERNTDPCKVGK